MIRPLLLLVSLSTLIAQHKKSGAYASPGREDGDGSSTSLLPWLAEDMIQPATTWLLARRTDEDGWGAETPRALLALLRLAARSGSDRRWQNRNEPDPELQWSPNKMEGLLVKQQLDMQLLLLLLRNQGSTPMSRQELANTFARFSLTLSAMCRNPRDFYQNDIVGPIMTAGDPDRQHQDSLDDEIKGRQEPDQEQLPFTFAFHVLSVCAGGGRVKRRHVVRLLEMAGSQQETHNIDALSMVAMATNCLARRSSSSSNSSSAGNGNTSGGASKYRQHLADYLETPLRLIASEQEPDGSFDHNVPTTALAIQALTSIRLQSSAAPITWKLEAALDWLRSVQKADGSFGNDIFTTAEVLMALSGYGYGTLDPEHCTPVTGRPAPSIGEDGSPASTTPIPSAGPVANHSGLVRFTYVVWIGQNRSEVHAIHLTVPANSTFYQAMKVAAEADPHFEFSATIWPNGHYVHTIAGHKDQSIGFHFWLLFRMPFMPDPFNPPPTTYVAPAGVDDLFPQDGDYFLFWYKDV